MVQIYILVRQKEPKLLPSNTFLDLKIYQNDFEFRKDRTREEKEVKGPGKDRRLNGRGKVHIR